MEIKFVNPYAAIGADFTTGMDSIASSLSMIYPNQTIDDLTNAVYNKVMSQYSLDSTTL